MATPERTPESRYKETSDALPPLGMDPLITSGARADPANSQDPLYTGKGVVAEPRRGGSGMLIAAVVVVLAVVAYFVFAPSIGNTPAPADQPAAAPATTEPAAPAADAPAAMAPAPAETAPAAPAASDAAPAPATPAPAAPAN